MEVQNDNIIGTTEDGKGHFHPAFNGIPPHLRCKFMKIKVLLIFSRKLVVCGTKQHGPAKHKAPRGKNDNKGIINIQIYEH